MSSDSYRGADPALVESWIAGWALCKETQAPRPIEGGWRVEVGWPDQRARLVFPRVCDALADAAGSIREPWVYLKVCAPCEHLRGLLPPRWEVQPRGYLMSLPELAAAPAELPPDYRIVVEQEGPVSLARVLTEAGERAAWGRVARSGDFAVFDRIETEAPYRRRGLATAVMGVLTEVGRAMGARGGLLVGTEMGRRLYDSLGWGVVSPYSSAVIRPV